ncbi:MAG: HyaD/HybD family hydrogenase maturation endopeptidase [Deltaproteobacteria bacterium]|nr:HyaD/HybD family hydrogenase maturation endopeptidase [Deltaproteobacteria bacterium]
MTKPKALTILGLGNILLGDEGFGVHFVRWFEARRQLPPSVAIVDGGTMGYALLDTVCSCDALIVIDCLKTADTPGSLYRFTRDELADRLPPPTSAHEVKFPDVLCKAEMLGECPEIVFLCIIPESYGDMDLEMTSTVKGRFPAMEALLLEELKRRGFTPETVAA